MDFSDRLLFRIFFNTVRRLIVRGVVVVRVGCGCSGGGLWLFGGGGCDCSGGHVLTCRRNALFQDGCVWLFGVGGVVVRGGCAYAGTQNYEPSHSMTLHMQSTGSERMYRCSDSGRYDRAISIVHRLLLTLIIELTHELAHCRSRQAAHGLPPHPPSHRPQRAQGA